MEDKTYELTLLYDFFGELLTDTQREYFEYYFLDDLSLGEIAELTGVTRQAVRAVVSRARSLLCQYEEKTGVVARFSQMAVKLDALSDKARTLASLTDGRAKELALELSEGLAELKGLNYGI